MAQEEQHRQKAYPQLIEDIGDWPVSKLFEDRSNFVEQIIQSTYDRLMDQPTERVKNILASTIYLERIRIKEEPWKVDPPNERNFWRRVRKELVKYSLDREEKEARESMGVIMHKILERYTEEIVGTFNPKTFLFSRWFLTGFFNRLLNATTFYRFWGSKKRVVDRLKVHGDVDMIRGLFSKGTVVIVPTHFSNLDSILIAYAMDAALGLPTFSYGAGLNLYNTGYTAYFMNRLGLYRVDRRKKNPIYLENLKVMSQLAIERGTNMLFFPGGTRSRSGSKEDKLKLGLLGTVVDAQQSLYAQGKNDKIFIVPLVLSYDFVLEAKYLIEQHLKKTGKEQYLEIRDSSYSRRKILQFVWELFSKSSDINLSFGKPLDVLGNFIDEDGNSYDRQGNPIEVRDYFLSNGRVTFDRQREREYTRYLGERISERFHKDNVALPSHLVAYTVFEILRKQHGDLDLYGILRLPPDDFVFELDQVKDVVQTLQKRLLEIESEGHIKLLDTLRKSPREIIEEGVKKLGLYHAKMPLKWDKEGNLVSQDFKLLYYYRNHLDHYGLSKYVEPKATPSELALMEE